MGYLGWRRITPRNALLHDVRGAILAQLRAEPGSHLRSLARSLGLTAQNASYHLRQLEACGLVASTRQGAFKCYYPRDGGRPLREAARARGALSSAVHARVLSAVLRSPGTHAGEVARRLGVADGSVSWSVRRLRKAGFVEVEREGNRRLLYVTPDGATALAGSVAAAASPVPPGVGRAASDAVQPA